MRRFTRREARIEKKAAMARPEDVRIPIVENEPPYNRYYIGISRIYHLFQYIFLAVALLFALTCIVADPEIISYRNFLMCVRDINMTLPQTERYSTLTYTTKTPAQIRSYKGGIVVPGEDTLFVFSATGKRTLSADHGFWAPTCVSSDSGILLYDFGTTSFSVYNGYTRLYRGEAKSPVYAADISDSGRYALVQKNDSGQFFVTVYEDDHKELATLRTVKYVTSALLDGDGDELVVLSFSVIGGEIVCEVGKYNCNNEELVFSYTEKGSTPLSAALSKDGKLCVLTDKGAMFLDNDGALIGKVTVDSVEAFDANDSFVAIYGDGEALIASFDGEVLRREMIDIHVRSVALAEGRLFLLGRNTLTAFDADGGEIRRTDIKGDYDILLAPSKNHPVLCGMTTAALAEW